MGYIFQLEQASLPIVGVDDNFPVRRIYCVGRNYLDHIRETAGADEREPPFFFQKPDESSSWRLKYSSSRRRRITIFKSP